MANLTITSTTNSIKVDFGDTHFFDKEVGVTFSKGTWRKDEIMDIGLQEDGNFVIVNTKDGVSWRVSYNAVTGAFIVDTVDAATPSSNSDLYDKLIALIA